MAKGNKKKVELLRVTLAYVIPFLEDYLEMALENGHPEFVGHAALALKKARDAMKETK